MHPFIHVSSLSVISLQLGLFEFHFLFTNISLLNVSKLLLIEFNIVSLSLLVVKKLSDMNPNQSSQYQSNTVYYKSDTANIL